MEIRNKRGVFFTFLAFTIITAIFMSFTGVPRISFYQEQEVVESEFLLLTAYTKDLQENYVKNVLISQTYKALNTMLNYNNETGPINNVSEEFTELITDGTLFGIPRSEMNGQLTSDWTDKIDQMADEVYSIDSNLTILNATMAQYSPWHIRVVVNFTVDTRLKNMSYLFNDSLVINIPITGLRDPVYLINDGTPHTINRTEVVDWDSSAVLEMLQDRTYRHTVQSPSFLMRLVGDNTNSTCCGIESLINSNYVNPVDYNVSFVDYLFWSRNRSCDVSEYEMYNYSGVSDTAIGRGFILDTEYSALYNLSVSERLATTCRP